VLPKPARRAAGGSTLFKIHNDIGFENLRSRSRCEMQFHTRSLYNFSRVTRSNGAGQSSHLIFAMFEYLVTEGSGTIDHRIRNRNENFS
jgi:hypothetical protein